MQHSAYGASSMYRWSVCPGSIEHLENNPMPSSSYADEGTQAHDCAEWQLTVELNGADDADMPDAPLEMWDNIQIYVDHCVSLVKAMGLNGEHAIEQRFTLKGIHDEAFGTNDFSCWLDFDQLNIVDLKYGAGIEVFPENNKQLMYYALGCIIENDLDVDIIKLHIVQPRIESEEKIKTHIISYAELMEFREELMAAIARVLVDSDKRVPGTHCRFCNKVKCPEFIKHMQAETSLDVTDAIELESTEVLSVDQLAKIIKAESMVKQFLSDAKTLFQDMAERGTIHPADHGMKLVKSLGNTAFIDPDNIPYRKLGLKKDDIYTQKLKTATQIKKLVPKDKQELFGDLVERPERGFKLVNEKAKGEPVKSIVEDTLNLN